ncbi:hypothetical protein AMECASPLE_014423, partial [Ameca splendens]
SEAVENKEWERETEQGSQWVLCLAELVYFQACKSNSQATRPHITHCVSLCPSFSSSFMPIRSSVQIKKNCCKCPERDEYITLCTILEPERIYCRFPEFETCL